MLTIQIKLCVCPCMHVLPISEKKNTLRANTKLLVVVITSVEDMGGERVIHF